MYNSEGKKTGKAQLDIYGKTRTLWGSKRAMPFRYPSQYEDVETGLYYKRFRYYDSEDGVYVRQDPIKISGSLAMYLYVHIPNAKVDEFGLARTCSASKLKGNMNKANKGLVNHKGHMKRAWNKKDCSAAHHIVPGDDPRAAVSRDILNKPNIQIDSAENCIFLRHMSRNTNKPGAYHRKIHTDMYCENINNRIEATDILGGKDAVKSELESVSDDLLFNKKI